jgi:undecaprenyl-diphosphatase
MTEKVESIEHTVLAWLGSHATPWLDQRAVEVTALGDGFTVTVLIAVAAALLWLTKARVYAACVVAAGLGAGILTPLLKNAVARPRPDHLELRAWLPETSYAYPSGHALLATATLCVLAWVIHRLAGRRDVTALVAVVASLLILLTGMSRLYLGVHYPSDVFAGHLIGFGWAMLCIRAAESIRRRTGERSMNDHIQLVEER